MKPPIIVYEAGDVVIFRSVEDAERYLESPDVLEGRYVAYDSTGKLLDLKAQDVKAMRFLGIKIYNVKKVAISSGEFQPSHAEDLRQILRDLLKHFGVPTEWLEKATLDDLLNKSIENVGFRGSKGTQTFS